MKAEFNTENQLVLTPQSQAERIALELVMRDKDRVVVADVKDDEVKRMFDHLATQNVQNQCYGQAIGTATKADIDSYLKDEQRRRDMSPRPFVYGGFKQA